MKVALTSRDEIKAKSGEEYVIYRGVTEKGKVVEAFVKRAEDSLSPNIKPDLDLVKGLFDILPNVDVEFNELGRVESVSAIEE